MSFETLTDGVDPHLQAIIFGQIRVLRHINNDHAQLISEHSFIQGMNELTIYYHLITSFKDEFYVHQIVWLDGLRCLTHQLAFFDYTPYIGPEFGPK